MRFLLLAILLLPLPVRADSAPATVASIAPVHSLVARVMQGAGEPYLLVPPGTSPHDYAMRPSDAAALEDARLIFWVGPGIEPWLERALGTLASEARVVRLDAVPGLTRLAVREDVAFEAHEDDEGHDDAHGHDDDAADPHLWLDPENAKLWLGAIARTLAEADPAKRALYVGNAEKAQLEIDALQARIDARLAPVRGRPFIVFHDAFHYFEHRFEIEAAGAVALSDARPPGPARVAEIRALIKETGAVCLFREPQFRSGIIETVAEGTNVRIGVLDPVGATLAPGPGLYPALIEGLADSLADCLG